MQYKKYKTFNATNFLHELDQKLLKGNMYKNKKDMFSTFTNSFQGVLNKQPPLKSKKVRGNQSQGKQRN